MKRRGTLWSFRYNVQMCGCADVTELKNDLNWANWNLEFVFVI